MTSKTQKINCPQCGSINFEQVKYKESSGFDSYRCWNFGTEFSNEND